MNHNNINKNILGILGGLGPIASAHLLKQIYENIPEYNIEQTLPNIILWSDPTLPDRSSFILQGKLKELQEALLKPLNSLLDSGATKLLICCYTAYAVATNFPNNVKAHLIDLPRLAIESVNLKQNKILILCTLGSRLTNIFNNFANIPTSNFIFPSSEDHIILHDIIYRIKKGEKIKSSTIDLYRIILNYEINGVLFGCSELSLCTNELRQHIAENSNRITVYDPLEKFISILHHNANFPLYNDIYHKFIA